MNRLVPIFVVILGALYAFWGGNFAQAGDVRVEEVTISLYNKPVTGFRVVLDRSQSFVTKQVLKHVAESEAAKPFQYERTIIYENIRYAPIATDRDVSLYFLLRDLQGQFSELTYVVMYDYKRSISSREFPQLALRLQIDLAKLVRATTGDILQAKDLVFDDATLAKLQIDRPDDTSPDASSQSSPDVEHFQEEEVENAGVLIHRDPFAKADAPEPASPTVVSGSDTALIRLRTRIQKLEAREQELLRQTRSLKENQDLMARKQELMQGKVRQNKALRDSIVLLNQRIEGLLGQYYVADDVSMSSETSEQVFELEKTKSQNQRYIDQLEAENDSLSNAASRMFKQLSALSQTRKEQVETLTALQEENGKLNGEVKELRLRNNILETGISDNQSADSLAQLLTASYAQNADLQTKLAAENSELARLQEDNDWLTGKKLQLESRILDLEKENQNLHETQRANLPGTVRIPEPTGVPSEAGTAALRDSLQQMQQRLAFLEKSGTDNAQQQALLQEKDNALAQKSQQLKVAEQTMADQAKAIREDQATRRQLNSDLRTAQTQLRQKDGDLKALRAERDQLASDKLKAETQLRLLQDQAGQSGAATQSLLDSIAGLRQRSRNLQSEIQNRDRQVRRQVQARDSLQSLVETGNNQRNELRRQLSRLETRVDSLRNTAAPVSDQQQFLREQRNRLQQMERDLQAREKTLADREKLAIQRQTFIEQKEEAFRNREAQLQDLEAREADLLLREQQLNARSGISGVEVRPQDIRNSRVVEFGENVPVFIVETNLSFKAARKQVVGYFLSRDEILDEQFPDILYRSVNIPELSDRPLTIKARIDSKGTGTILQISIRLENETYLGTEATRKTNEKAKQLISSLLRYKNQG